MPSVRRLSACLLLLATAAFAADEPLIVHEWGVSVRSSTTRGTLLSAPQELVSQLPSFVQVLDKQYTPKRQDHGWDKPVIHFYGPDGLAVNVKVLTPQGRLTTYFPAGQIIEKKINVSDHSIMTMYSLTDCIGMEWAGTLSKEPKAKLGEPKKDHWWSLVRAVPSAYINIDKGSERFIFYEATAYQEPVVTGAVSGDAIKIINKHIAPSGAILLLVNDGAKHYLKAIDAISASSDVTLAKGDVLKTPVTDDEILDAARKQWTSFGLTKEEAIAIVDTWRPDLLLTPGFLLISRMPTDLYDKMFPLKITPEPRELVRAGVVFDTLPGNAERIGWIPEISKYLDGLSAGLASEEFETRRDAAGKLAKMGDLITPYLEKLSKSGDAETADAVKRLIEQLQPLKVPAAMEQTGLEDHFLIRRQAK
jgi:hypothetical protein